MCSCRAVRLGGPPYPGAYAGVLNFNANNAPSNANWNYGGEILPFTGLKIILIIILKQIISLNKTGTYFSTVMKITEIYPTGTA